MQPYSQVNHACVFYTHFFRAFGDKSGPPSLPDAESEGVNGEDCEVSEEEEEEVQCVQEEHTPSEKMTGEACSAIEELSLTEVDQEEEKAEKGNEEEEGNQDCPKGMSQGIIFSPMSC